MTGPLHPALLDASGLLPHPAGYALAYGSHAHGTAGPHSDLDLLFTGPRPLTGAALDELVAAVIALHHRHGLDLDEEVPYRVKLHLTLDQAAAAAGGASFTILPVDGGTAPVPDTIREAWFLGTDAFAARLALNALTSPHVFLAGDVDTYRAHVLAAEQTLARLAAALTGRLSPALGDLLAALWRAPDGRSGKDYLGYLVAPHLLGVLARGRASLPAYASESR